MGVEKHDPLIPAPSRVKALPVQPKAAAHQVIGAGGIRAFEGDVAVGIEGDLESICARAFQPDASTAL
jgi:hypothetical protein